MPQYYYKAMTKNGTIVKNKVEDVNRVVLMRKLKSNGLTPILVMQTSRKRRSKKKKEKRNTNQGIASVAKDLGQAEMYKRRNIPKSVSLFQKVNAFLTSRKGVKPRDILVFTQNFYLLKKSNFNNIHALSTILETTDNFILKEIIEDILAGVEAGEAIYTTMEYYEGIFPPIYINMIKSGELSGALTETLAEAITYLEDTISLNKKIKNILIPNLIQFVGILILLIFGTVFMLPMVQNTYDAVGSTATLPPQSIWFSNVIDVFFATWYIYVIILAAIIGGIIWYINTPSGRYNFDYFKYKAPVFGKLIYALDFTRFMTSVLMNIRTGTRIQESLEVSKHTVKNLVLLSVIETSINNVIMGRSWIEPFESSGLSSTMAVEMMKIGMQTDLTVMLEKLIDFMHQDIDKIMQRIMKVLPQIVYALVGIVLIFMVLVVLVPLIEVYMGGFLFDAAGV